MLRKKIPPIGVRKIMYVYMDICARFGFYFKLILSTFYDYFQNIFLPITVVHAYSDSACMSFYHLYDLYFGQVRSLPRVVKNVLSKIVAFKERMSL